MNASVNVPNSANPSLNIVSSDCLSHIFSKLSLSSCGGLLRCVCGTWRDILQTYKRTAGSAIVSSPSLIQYALRDCTVRGLGVQWLLSSAARTGHLDVVQRLLDERCVHWGTEETPSSIDPNSLFPKAAAAPTPNVVSWMLDTGVGVDEPAIGEGINMAVLYERVDTLHLLLQKYDFLVFADTYEYAVGCESIEPLKLLISANSYPIDCESIIAATMKGNLDALKLLYPLVSSYMFHERFDEIAAMYGHLHILNWVLEDTDLLLSFHPYDIASNGKDDKLKDALDWLFSNRSNPRVKIIGDFEDILFTIACRSNFDVLDWYFQNISTSQDQRLVEYKDLKSVSQRLSSQEPSRRKINEVCKWMLAHHLPFYNDEGEEEEA